MDISERDRQLIAAIQDGLPLHPLPYAEVGARIGMNEDEVLERLRMLQESGVIKRMGVIVRHHELGYRANAMLVWDVPDAEVAALGQCLGRFDFVTLCYRRPRRPPEWPYNLFCMIHGRDRDEVMQNVAMLVEHCGLQHLGHKVLFSRRRFKQRGAVYTASTGDGAGALLSPVRVAGAG